MKKASVLRFAERLEPMKAVLLFCLLLPVAAANANEPKLEQAPIVTRNVGSIQPRAEVFVSCCLS